MGLLQVGTDQVIGLAFLFLLAFVAPKIPLNVNAIVFLLPG